MGKVKFDIHFVTTYNQNNLTWIIIFEFQVLFNISFECFDFFWYIFSAMHSIDNNWNSILLILRLKLISHKYMLEIGKIRKFFSWHHKLKHKTYLLQVMPPVLRPCKSTLVGPASAASFWPTLLSLSGFGNPKIFCIIKQKHSIRK